MSNLLQLAEATQKAAQQVQNLDGFLKAYREVMGPVEDFRELRETGNSNLLTMRFAIMRNVRDDEVKKAKDLAKQLADNAKGLSSSQ